MTEDRQKICKQTAKEMVTLQAGFVHLEEDVASMEVVT